MSKEIFMVVLVCQWAKQNHRLLWHDQSVSARYPLGTAKNLQEKSCVYKYHYLDKCHTAYTAGVSSWRHLKNTHTSIAIFFPRYKINALLKKTSLTIPGIIFI